VITSFLLESHRIADTRETWRARSTASFDGGIWITYGPSGTAGCVVASLIRRKVRPAESAGFTSAVPEAIAQPISSLTALIRPSELPGTTCFTQPDVRAQNSGSNTAAAKAPPDAAELAIVIACHFLSRRQFCAQQSLLATMVDRSLASRNDPWPHREPGIGVDTRGYGACR